MTLESPDQPIDQVAVPAVPAVMTAAAPTAISHRRIARNVLSMFVFGIAARFLSLLVNIVARRTLGVAAIGEVTWTAAVVSYFSMVINPGLETIARREVTKDPGKSEYYFLRLLSLQLVLATVSIAAIFVISIFSAVAAGLRGMLLAQALSLIFAPLFPTFLLLARERMVLPAATDIVLSGLMLPAALFLLHGPNDKILYVLLPYPIRTLIIVLQFIQVFRIGALRPRKLLVPTNPFRGISSFVLEALPIGLSQVAVMVYYNCDTLLLGIFRDQTTVGLYGTAYQVMLLGIVFSSSLYLAFFPALARSVDDDVEARRISRQYLQAVCWPGFTLAGCGFAFGRWAVPLLYGPKFVASGPILEPLSIDLIFLFINGGFTTTLVTWGRQKTVLYITIGAAVLNLGLNLLLIPRYGITAAIATTILAEAFVTVLTYFARRKLHPIPFFRIVLPPLLICASVTLVGKFLALRDPGHWMIYAAACGALLGGFFCAIEGRRLIALLRRR